MLQKSLSASFDREREQKFQEIYANYRLKLYYFGWKLLPQQEVLEDLIQDIFLEFWEKDRAIQIHLIEAYLKTALKHKILNYFRRQKIEQRYKVEENELEFRMEDSIVHYIYYQELLERIHTCIQALPNKCKLVFELNWYGMLSNEEIAQQVGISLKTVESHLSKALRYLQYNLQKEICFFIARKEERKEN